MPSGTEAEFSATFYNGEYIPLSWSGWGSRWLESYLNEVSINDLWVASYNYFEEPYKNFNVSQPGSYIWQVNISESMLSKTPKYVFQFKSPASPQVAYDPKSKHLSSPAVVILKDASQPSPTLALTASSTSPTTTITTATATRLVPTPSKTSKPKTAFDPGSIVGITVGCIAIGLSLIALSAYGVLWFVLDRKAATARRQRRMQWPSQPGVCESQGCTVVGSSAPTTLEAKVNRSLRDGDAGTTACAVGSANMHVS
ncbi:hypothetical protein PRK78_004809 [Emydomyces testavorans]|uniref:Ig-like domain-containing protein n=1 Tax=Emydomyces testavorans TaxID=2070801 RepID=A0AAF0IM15_9EURO|nr:hypothetical protein PRK78_004809 [Emydomyces testavorans]